ncbi:MAG: hypothetical protein ACREMJ_05345, partial [Gemmatimonadales bacterium]
LGVRRVSDVVRANRVEGLALGAGYVWRARAQGVEARVLASYGFADHRLKGALTVSDASGVELSVYREVRDVGDVPVVSPLVNSIAAQELGRDYGDYYLAEGARAELTRPLSPRAEWHVDVGRERIRTLAARAAPASGTLRLNPPLGDTALSFVRAGVRRRSGGFAVRRDLYVDLAVEVGRLDGGADYARASAAGHVLLPAGGTRILVRAQGGVASADVPPHRAFVLGGRGTLLGDGFRDWGGRRAAVIHAEWRVPVRGLAIGIGPYAELPAAITLAPYIAAGWADRPVLGTPWTATPGTRVTVGLGVECLGLLRVEAGLGLQSRRTRFAVDVARDFWDIL